MKRGTTGRYETGIAGGEKVRVCSRTTPTQTTAASRLANPGTIGERRAGLLGEPLLYLSVYFRQHRQQYYELLDLVRRDGDWETWLNFFLQGVTTTAAEAVSTSRTLITIFAEDRARIVKTGRRSASGLLVHEGLKTRPLTSLQDLSRRTGLSFPAASAAMSNLVDLGIARERTGKRRGRIFAYTRYMQELGEGKSE